MFKVSPAKLTLWRIEETVAMMRRAKKYLIQEWGKEIYDSRLTNLKEHLKVRTQRKNDSTSR